MPGVENASLLESAALEQETNVTFNAQVSQIPNLSSVEDLQRSIILSHRGGVLSILCNSETAFEQWYTFL